MDQILFEAPGCPSLRLRFDTTTLIKDDKKAGSSCPRGEVRGREWTYLCIHLYGGRWHNNDEDREGCQKIYRNGVTVIH
jgi:hypothetical protein